MNAVHGRVRHHTQLGVLSGTDVLFIERLSSRDAVVNFTLIGGRLALPLSSSGIVLLAHAEADLVDRVIAGGWPHPTAATIRDGTELRERLARARADGFVALDGHLYDGSRGIAVPVYAPHGPVAAALSVVVPNDAAPVQPIVELLRVAAAGISRELGDAHVPSDAHAGEHVDPVARALVSTSHATLDYFAHLGMDVTRE